MGNVNVHNLNSTGDRKPDGYGSWLDFGDVKCSHNTSFCQNSTCASKREVGAHVQKDSANDKRWYIIPLCKACNKKTTSFSVPEEYLVRLTETE